MKVRIGNLGEMAAEFTPDQVKRQGDYLVVSLKASGTCTTWSAAVAADYSDIIKIAKLAIKLSVISFLLFGIKSRKKPGPVGEF